MSDLINPAMAGSYLITLNYHFVGGDAETPGAYAEDLVRAAFEEIAALKNNFSAFYHYLEVTRSEDGSPIKCKVASYFDEEACSINLKIEFVDGPMMIELSDLEKPGGVGVH